MLSVPHTPHADAAAVTVLERAPGSRGGAPDSVTVTTLNSCSALSRTSVQ